MLFRPHQNPSRKDEIVVEPPGTAPGSSPLITRAFIVISGKPAHTIWARKRKVAIKKPPRNGAAFKSSFCERLQVAEFSCAMRQQVEETHAALLTIALHGFANRFDMLHRVV